MGLRAVIIVLSLMSAVSIAANSSLFLERTERRCVSAAECPRGEICPKSSRVCSLCTKDTDCGNRQVCEVRTEGNRCVMTPLKGHIDRSVVLCWFLTFLAGILSSGGGVGGGGIFVPIFIFALGVDSHEAIPMSKSAVFGGSLGNLLFTAMRRNPSGTRPLIDYDVALALEPSTLLGTVIGVLFNVLLSHYALVTMLSITLFLLFVRALQKAVSTFQQETERKGLFPDQESSDPRSSDRRNGSGPVTLGHTPSGLLEEEEESLLITRNTENHLLSQIKAEESVLFPFKKILALFVVWFIILSLSLLRGGHGTASIVGISPCSTAYFAIYFSVLPIISLFMAGVSLSLLRETRRKREAHYNYMEGDVVWSVKNAVVYPIVSTLTGVAAGMLGIGGGMIKGIILMEMGLHPSSLSATISLMVLMTSSSTVAQFGVMGALRSDWSMALIAITFTSSLFGQRIISLIIKKTRRPSVILFCIATVIGISTVLLTITSLKAKEEAKGGPKLDLLSKICYKA